MQKQDETQIKRGEKKQQTPVAVGVVFQLPMYSCRDVFATVWIHTNSVLQGTYRQLMSLRLEAVKGISLCMQVITSESD